MNYNLIKKGEQKGYALLQVFIDKLNLKLYKKIFLISIFSLGIYFRFLWANLSQWRHEEALILWISLTKNIFQSPFSNVSSPGIPNPNLSVILSKVLNLFDSFIVISLFLSTVQSIAIYYFLKSSDKRFNIILGLSLCFNSYFVFVSSTIALHMIVLIFNALFLKLVFDYCVNKKYYLASYFSIATILPVSIYLGGFSNTIIYFLIFSCILIINFRNFKLNFSSKHHLSLGFGLVSSILILTWYQYFTNIDFDSLKIQNSGTQLFPYSRIRDYIYLGFQNTKIFPYFFLDIFSKELYIYWPFQFSDKFSPSSKNLVAILLGYHKIFNIISILFILFGFITSFSKYKKIVNNTNLIKATFTLFMIYVYTVLTPILGQGRSFLDFDMGSLMVYSSTYILYVYLWTTSFFIFNLNKIFFVSLLVFLCSFYTANLLTSYNLAKEFKNSISVNHSVADESTIHKEAIVDFLDGYVDDKISIYYNLIEFEYGWSNYFNEINYSSSYYEFIYSNGREFDYLLKRKYGIDNSQEGKLIRSPKNTQFFLSYSFTEFPRNIYQNYKIIQFGNYSLMINLDF